MKKILKFIFLSVFVLFVLSSCSNEDFFVDVAIGDEYSVVLTKIGTVYFNGKNKFGEHNVMKWRDIVAIASGNRHVVGVKKDGTVVACGDNEDNQCDVQDWTDVVAVDAGDRHTVGLKKDGTVVATGDNRVRAELALHDPMAYLLTGTIAKKIANTVSTELAGVSPEYAVRFKLLRIMALRNLEKKYAPEAGVTENQIEQEERAVRNSMAYRILSDPNHVGAIDFAALAGENYDTALENALYASPARKPVLLGDVAENSFEGKRIL